MRQCVYSLHLAFGECIGIKIHKVVFIIRIKHKAYFCNNSKSNGKILLGFFLLKEFD